MGISFHVFSDSSVHAGVVLAAMHQLELMITLGPGDGTTIHQAVRQRLIVFKPRDLDGFGGILQLALEDSVFTS